jgi:hypothetical protein
MEDIIKQLENYTAYLDMGSAGIELIAELEDKGYSSPTTVAFIKAVKNITQSIAG